VVNEALLEPVLPTAPVAPWIGGRRNLARRIIARLAQVEHTAYVGPFVGMGGVFLRRPSRARAEVINDASREVATLFRVLQRHYVPFLDMLRWQLTSRREFERLLATAPDTLTDLERAARFLYLQRLAFGGKVCGQNFGVQLAGGARFDITKLASLLEAVHERLAGVVIECLPGLNALPATTGPARCSTSTRPTGARRASTGGGCSPRATSRPWPSGSVGWRRRGCSA
jgi:DNA adenine methylase